MRIRKQICLFLIPLLGFSFFASGAAAEPSCNDAACQKMAVKAEHSHVKVAALASDCCARHQQMPCELERRRSDGLSAFCVSPFRLDTYKPVNFISSTDVSPLNRHIGGDPVWYFTADVTARSSPIYLKNLALLC